MHVELADSASRLGSRAKFENGPGLAAHLYTTFAAVHCRPHLFSSQEAGVICEARIMNAASVRLKNGVARLS